MDIHASGRTDNSRNYSDDSIDRDIRYHNYARRGRTRFSNADAGDGAGRNFQRRLDDNDRTRDSDLNYLNRQQTERMTRRAGNFIRDDNVANMRQNFSDVYRSDARRNLNNFSGEDLVTPEPNGGSRRRQRSSDGRHSRRNSSSRSRSRDSETSESSDSSSDEMHKAFRKMQNRMTPNSSSKRKTRRNNDGSRSKVLEARSLQQELGSETARRVKKSMDHWISIGPPMLKENEEAQGFFKWQTAMKTFVGRLPGYLPGMLEKKPDYENMSNKEQGRLRDIYTNIHSWLCKAVSSNSRVCSKTKAYQDSPLS